MALPVQFCSRARRQTPCAPADPGPARRRIQRERLRRRNRPCGGGGKRGFVVAFLEGSGTTPGARTFNSGACCGYAQARQIDDVAYARSVVAMLVAQGRVDPARVYAVGFSNGGMMAYRLAAQAPELVAGVAVVSGTLDIDPALARVAKPVLHIHGTADPYVPYAGGVGAKATTAKPRLAVESAVETWARLGCATAPRPAVRRTASLPDAAGDGTRVERREYGCAGAPPAVLYVIDGGGHAWPSGRLKPIPKAARARATWMPRRRSLPFSARSPRRHRAAPAEARPVLGGKWGRRLSFRTFFRTRIRIAVVCAPRRLASRKVSLLP
ncbi:prolyl oligopeptidase family serine peptidase [Achromobacter xylosoxidans]